MFSTSGRRRLLTDAQVRRILEWQRNRKTLSQVARENRVSRVVIYTVIRNGGQYKRSLPLTDLELRRILEWQRHRKTVVQVARQYGISISTVHDVIRTGGKYKRLPPQAPSMSSREMKKRAGSRR